MNNYNIKRNLGEFESTAAVWRAYPAGGEKGDVVQIADKQRYWDDVAKDWKLATEVNNDTTEVVKVSPTRRTTAFDGDVDVSNNLNIGGILRARIVRGRSAAFGLFESEDELLATAPRPLKGQWAMVLIDNRTDEDDNAVGEVYYCPKDGIWQDAGFTVGCADDADMWFNEMEQRMEEDQALRAAIMSIKPTVVVGDVTNNADEEDITAVDGVLKLKDKAHQPATFSGLGRVILRKNIVDGVNILTQEMLSATNTHYIIQYDYTLNYEQLTIPAGCILEFRGGSITNGTLVGNNTILLHNRPTSAILPSVTFAGTFSMGADSEKLQEDINNCYTKEETYSKTQLDNMITTPQVQYVTVEATSETTDVHSVLPATGAGNTLYRVGKWDGTQYDVTKYTEYSWDGTDYVPLTTKSQVDEVFDISVYHAIGGTPAQYADLSAALVTNGTINVPEGIRKGGMSVKFIQSSDNKYVQYRLMSGTFNTTEANWQGVDDEPTAGSNNLVKSGGVHEEIGKSTQYANKFDDLAKFKGWIGASAYSYVESGNANATHVVVPCNAGDNVHIKASNSYACLFFVVKSYTVPTADGETPDFVNGESSRRVVQNSLTLDFTAPSGTQYLVVGYQLNDAIYTPAEFTINGYNVLENIREAINKNTSEIANNAESIKETTFGVYGGKFTLNISGTYSTVPLGEIVPKGCVLTDIGAYAGDLWLVDTQSNNYRVRGVPFVLTTDISGVIVGTAGTINLTFSAINDVFNTVSEYKSEDFALGYYNTGSVSIGDYLPEFRAYENTAALMISVKAGDVITSKFQNNNSNEYCRGWILTDKDKKILSWSAEGNLDYLTNPLEQIITNDGYLIIHHQPVTSLSSVLISQYRRVINLNETIKEESTKAVQDYIEEQGISKDFVQICLPDRIYAIAGDTLQLFYRGFIKAVNPYNYDIKITCSVGQQFSRYYQYAPAASASNRTDDLLVQVKNNAGNILAEKTIQIITCSAPVSPDSQKHVLIFGDSLTAKGQWAAEAYRRLVGNGGSPAGKQLSNISFDGAMVKNGAGYFGIGGWTWNDYETNISGFRFQVSGVTALNNGDSYICNGSTFTLAENNTTDGVGEIMMIRIAGSASPDISGSLQRVSGVGDEIINYSSWSEDVGNPLWDSNNNKMSFVPYANNYSDGKIDVVYVPLGGNSVQAWQTNFNAMKTAIKKFVDTLHAEFPNAKCKIVGLEIPSVRGGAGGNIATGVRLSDQYGMTNGVMNMNMFYQEFANSSETSGTSGDAYNTFVEYVDIASQFDTEYNMPHEMVDVNSRNSVDKEWRDTNQLHPADCGYMQIADVIYRNFVANYCQS